MAELPLVPAQTPVGFCVQTTAWEVKSPFQSFPQYHISMQERVTAAVHLSRLHCIRQVAFIQKIYQVKGLCLNCEIEEQR